MALCVSPPPQGFSQARCSSKILTEWPVRASSAPHMEPDGPPPTIAISAMCFLADLRRRSHTARCRCSGRDAFSGAELRVVVTLSDGKNHQGESSEEYSTEDCGGGRGLCPETNEVRGQTLQQGKDDEITDKQKEQDCSGMEIENA